MDHAVAVGAYEGEVGEFGATLAGLVEGDHMVALDEAGAAFAVLYSEVEVACFAGQAAV